MNRVSSSQKSIGVSIFVFRIALHKSNPVILATSSLKGLNQNDAL
jgi:hypothetical protein